jgi:hypothetical protein
MIAGPRPKYRARPRGPGRVLYAKGGFGFDGLSGEGQLEVEEDYQICLRRS